MNKTSGEGFAANDNKLVRSTGAITAIAGNGNRLRAWSLEGVYPVRWTGPEFGSRQRRSADRGAGDRPPRLP